MAYASSDVPAGTTRTGTTRRFTTETKSAFKTTEFMAYVAAVVVVIITALAVGKGDTGSDPVSALDALRYISYLTIGYMIARGLAKSGSREPYNADDRASKDERRA